MKDLDQFIFHLERGTQISFVVNRKINLWNGKVIIFTDGQGRKFVLKQINPNSSPWEKSTLVRDYVGSRIAEEMNLPINRVRLIPAKLGFSLKPFSGYPATLHTFVEGVVPKAGIQQKVGTKVPIEETGLNYSVIKNMAKSLDLQRITALDTFLGNEDRKNANLLYWNDHYVGIDLGDMLIHNLVKVAIHQFQSMIAKKMVFSLEEKRGLSNYHKTLNDLFLNYPVNRIVAYLDEGYNLSGLKTLGPNHYNVKDEMYFKDMARENVNAIPTLLQIMNNALTTHITFHG
ncbi:hypothetical protein J2Z48_003152 [Croceifilum oryzae]|uniref:Uncharacterized protein n=1 Tax=Croceifilum oryzae TaxID=1553429 RepID=A0AAJ1WRW5_9BACL|nr:hypothetical protein [Croceifilum oryzae]MDQ0418947.1 hypothetical protein [Croceifilum oryzae]